MPIEIGGLGFDPLIIGYIIGAYRAFVAIFLGACLSKAIHFLGERRLFIYAISCYAVVFALFPIISLCAKHFGVTRSVWIGVGGMLSLMAISDMAYGGFSFHLVIVVQGSITFTSQGCIFMIIISVSPNKGSLGTTNGLSQTTVSIARTVAPAVAASLFSFSVERHLLGGYAVYAVLFVLSCSAVFLASGLPSQRRVPQGPQD